MPELPEVEITRRAVNRYMQGKRISSVIVRQRRLRWPVPRGLAAKLTGETLQTVQRRGKYLLFHIGGGVMMVHLGMSGSLCFAAAASTAGKHDHVDWAFGERCLRFNDPRRFGSIHWINGDPQLHPLLVRLGPEPLSETFDGEYLYLYARGRRCSVKTMIMNSGCIVGVGNIYANEALFEAGIHPGRQAGAISRRRYRNLAGAIVAVLSRAIDAGGTTIRDFVSGENKPGYFQQQLQVYGKAGERCPRCGTALVCSRDHQRASYYCGKCQR